MNQHFPIRLPASLKWLSYVLLAASTISSCVKNETYLMPPINLGYVDPSPNGTYNLRPFRALIFHNGMVYYDSASRIFVNSMAFPVRFYSNASPDNTTNYSKDIPVTAAIDTGLLSLYRRLSGSSTPSLPAGAFSLANPGVTIKANSAVSTDSIKLIISDHSHLDPTMTYVVPVRVGSTIPGIFSPTDTLKQTVFFRISPNNVSLLLQPNNVRDGISSNDSTIYTQLIRQSDGTYVNALTRLVVAITAVLYFDMTASIAAIPEQVESYNAANGTSYTVMPSTGYNIANSRVTISGGALASSSPFAIQFASTLPSGNYLLPLQTGDSDAVGLDPTTTTSYITAIVEPKIVYSRTGWKILAVSGADTVGNNTAANVLDGSYGSYWGSSRKGSTAPPPQWFVVDMGQLNTVNGILFMQANQVDATQQPSQATMFVSTDNVNWDAGQQITIPPMPTPNKFLFIDLAASVQARYIKFVIQSTQASPAGRVAVAEFGAY
jgi:hypothetical protein